MEKVMQHIVEELSERQKSVELKCVGNLVSGS